VQTRKITCPAGGGAFPFAHRLRRDGLRGVGAQPDEGRRKGGKATSPLEAASDTTDVANIIFIGGLFALVIVGLVVAWVMSWRR
jgi:hypothetical protein